MNTLWRFRSATLLQQERGDYTSRRIPRKYPCHTLDDFGKTKATVKSDWVDGDRIYLFFKDLDDSFKFLELCYVGGRSGSYEEELVNARNNAMRELESRAYQVGADAVVGIDIDYEVLGANGNMLMVTASGTAVKLA